jgi:AraC family transcriptional regulator, transcriptional activator of pobA
MKKIPIRHIKSAMKERVVSGRFIIWRLSELFTRGDMIQEIHRHSFYFILIIEKGNGRHVIDFIPHSIVNRSIFIMHPGQVHELLLRRNSKGYLLQFPDDFFLQADHITKHLLKNVSQKNYYRPDPERFKKIISLMEILLQEAVDKKEKYEYVIQLSLQVFFIELLREEHSSIEAGQSNTIYNQERFAAFQDLITAHASYHKQVSWYAEKLHLTAYQLNAITKSTIGKTSSMIINEYVLLEAKRYLLATSNQIIQIAQLLGYDDVSYFIRFFKKHTGQSPDAFRNNFK